MTPVSLGGPTLSTSEATERLTSLVDPLGGLVGMTSLHPGRPGGPDFHLTTAHLGSFAEVLTGTDRAAATGTIDGSGGGTDRAGSSLRALAEAVERYSSCTFDERQFIVATAAELGDDALDLDRLPQCTQEEMAHRSCWVRPPDKTLPIRWVRGVDLHRTVPVWVPAVLVFMHLPIRFPGERFTLPISTGCAAHFNLAAAVVNGLCEVVERDAISLVWLHRLAIPHLDLAGVPELDDVTALFRSATVEIRLHDATSDIGIPVVYGTATETDDPELRTVVMAACGLSPVDAAAKALREAESCRMALEATATTRLDPDQFIDAFDGARHTGHPSRDDAFEFLRSAPTTRRLADLEDLRQPTDEADLVTVLERLKRAGQPAYAVELSGDEARRIGMRCVRTIVPGLQPLSFSPRTQFLAHPRFDAGPAGMGFRRAPGPMNPYPQPFS